MCSSRSPAWSEWGGWQGAAFSSQGPSPFWFGAGFWQLLVPWQQHPQAPVVGLTLGKSGVRQNGQTLISRIKFVGPLGCAHPLPMVQVPARTVRQLVHIPIHGVLTGWAFPKALVCSLGWCRGDSYPTAGVSEWPRCCCCVWSWDEMCSGSDEPGLAYPTVPACDLRRQRSQVIRAQAPALPLAWAVPQSLPSVLL